MAMGAGSGVNAAAPKKATKTADINGSSVFGNQVVSAPQKLNPIPVTAADYAGGGSGVRADDTMGQSGKVVASPQYQAPPTPPPGSGGDPRNIGGASMANATSQNNLYGNGQNQGTMDPVTGLLAQYGYSPDTIGNLYSNPYPLSSDVLNSMGINNPGLSTELTNYFQPSAAANMLINQGMGKTGTDNATLNFIAEAMKQAATPGGSFFDFRKLLNNLMGANAQGTSNPLGTYLNTDPQTGKAYTPANQVKIANALASQTLGTLNPYAQQAYAAALAQAGQNYQADYQHNQGTQPNYIDYLANNSQIGNWINR